MSSADQKKASSGQSGDSQARRPAGLIARVVRWLDKLGAGWVCD